MNLKTLLNAVAQAIHDDQDIQSWAAVRYSRRHKVYIGLDSRNPPGETDCPLVTVFPMGKVAGMELDSMEHDLGVTCVLFDDEEKVVTRDNLVVMESMGNLLDFYDLVRLAVIGLTASGESLADLDLNVMDLEIDTIEAFPYITASVEFKFDHEYYQGESDYFD